MRRQAVAFLLLFPCSGGVYCFGFLFFLARTVFRLVLDHLGSGLSGTCSSGKTLQLGMITWHADYFFIFGKLGMITMTR